MNQARKCLCERCELLEEKLMAEKALTQALFLEKIRTLARLVDLEHRHRRLSNAEAGFFFVTGLVAALMGLGLFSLLL